MSIKRPSVRRGIQVNLPSRQSLASGYWGNSPDSPKARVQADQVIERIIKANTDFISLGNMADIWVAPQESLHLLPQCGCVKVTNQSADVRCAKCYGVKLIPGYVKWGYNTMFFSAVNLGFTAQQEPGFNLPPTIEKNANTTLHTLQLTAGVLTSSFQTPDFEVSNPYSTEWELEGLIFNRAPGNSHNIEWSLDRGATWLGGNFKLLHLFRGTIRFRVTLTRTSLQTVSPQFEILRFRHPIQEKPWVRVSRPMGNRRKKREETGITEDESGVSFITVPVKGSAQVFGQTVWSKPWMPDQQFFIELKEGSFAGERYIPTSYSRSETLGVMTLQTFSVRRSIPNELFGAVF